MDNRQAQVAVIIPADFSEQFADVREGYDVLVIGIDPDDDRSDNLPHIEHLQRNARLWGVECYRSCLAEIYRVLRPGGILTWVNQYILLSPFLRVLPLFTQKAAGLARKAGQIASRPFRKPQTFVAMRGLIFWSQITRLMPGLVEGIHRV